MARKNKLIGEPSPTMDQKVIKILRHSKEFSQVKAAKELGISISSYCKIEAGQVDVPLSKLEKLANLFEIKTSEFIAMMEVSDKPNTSLMDENTILKLKVIELQKKIINIYDTLNSVKND